MAENTSKPNWIGETAPQPFWAATPARTSRQRHFWVPGERATVGGKTFQRGPMFVAWEAPLQVTRPDPVVLVHGGARPRRARERARFDLREKLRRSPGSGLALAGGTGGQAGFLTCRARDSLQTPNMADSSTPKPVLERFFEAERRYLPEGGSFAEFAATLASFPPEAGWSAAKTSAPTAA